MSTEVKSTLKNAPEVIEVKGNKLIETVQGIFGKGNVSRVIIYKENGGTLLDIPYGAGLTVTALVTIFMPVIALLTPFVLLLGRFKIEIIRPDAVESTKTEKTPPPPSEKAQAKATEMLEGISTNITKEANATSTESKAKVESKPVISEKQPEPDDLKQIKGIGEVFAGRLHEAGIHTFAQLAAHPPEELAQIVSPEKTEQMFDVQPWIAQARELSQENS